MIKSDQNVGSDLSQHMLFQVDNNYNYWRILIWNSDNYKLASEPYAIIVTVTAGYI